MATYTPVIASGSTNGRQIKVTATATAGTLLHTSHATDIDEVSIWATNTSTSPVKLTIELGGVTSPDDLIEQTIPPEMGEFLVVDAARVTGSVVVRAFAASANVINCRVSVNRITN